ncbi:hypothetical protein ACYJ1Y_11775 [Natrialbaceae archaeon A-gly3]
MKSLEVTDEQYAFIQQLREEISEQVVGKYGYVRERDAVQFLIDNLDGDLEFDGDFAVGDRADLAYDEDLEGGDEAADDGGALETEDGDDLEDESEDDGGEDDEPDDDDGAADDDDMLDRMMNLLDTHDDKWEESPSGDHRYRVTLPDDSTKDVQTKDDVRALLFQNY